MAPFVPTNSGDPDFEFYNWDKSHNNKFYKQTPGVCTTSKQELQSILNTTAVGDSTTKKPDHSSKPSENLETQSDDQNNIMEVGDELLGLPDNYAGLKTPEVKTNKRKRRKRFSAKKPGNLSRLSKRELEREISRNNEKLNNKIKMEWLKGALGNPWDDISFNEKKRFALHFYYSKLQVLMLLNYLRHNLCDSIISGGWVSLCWKEMCSRTCC